MKCQLKESLCDFIQFTGNNLDEIKEFTNNEYNWLNKADLELIIYNIYENVTMFPNEYLVKQTFNDNTFRYYVYNEDEFKELYFIVDYRR